MVTADYIFDCFKITNEEYAELDREFGELCHYAAWDLKKRNSRSNLTDEQEDIVQEMRWAISSAAVYFKRQAYLEDCMKAVEEHAKDEFVQLIIKELVFLWDNRKRHGANKQKFGEYQEEILENLVQTYVPCQCRPDKKRKLQMDCKFVKYGKSVVWNRCKNLGKKISRDLRVRCGQVSLSEFNFLATL